MLKRTLRNEQKDDFSKVVVSQEVSRLLLSQFLVQFSVLCFCLKLELVPDRGHFLFKFYAWYTCALKHFSASLVVHLAGFLLIVHGE